MKKRMQFNLEELLEDADFAYDKELGFMLDKSVQELKELEIKEIAPNPYQPRKRFDEVALSELRASLEQYGLLQPIVVLRADDENAQKRLKADGITSLTQKYFLIAGERRLRAAKSLGWEKITAVVANALANNCAELAIVENVQREGLNPIELAQALRELAAARKLTQEDLAAVVQKPRSVVANLLRLLNLRTSTQELIAQGKISVGHAKVMASHPDFEEILVHKVLENNYSVRECEKFLDEKKSPNKHKEKRMLGGELNEELKSLLEEIKVVLPHVSIKGQKITFDLSDEKVKNFLINAVKKANC